jgi:hypothetical protein
MARGNLQVSRRFCRRCGRHTKFEHNAFVWGCGYLILILATLGLWLIPKAVIHFLCDPWRCARCGSRR